MVGVTIALGEADVGLCQNLDVNKDDQVTVNELTQAVDMALHGCVTAGQ
jgi:hypothetical protein